MSGSYSMQHLTPEQCKWIAGASDDVRAVALEAFGDATLAEAPVLMPALACAMAAVELAARAVKMSIRHGVPLDDAIEHITHLRLFSEMMLQDVKHDLTGSADWSLDEFERRLKQVPV